MVESAIAFVVVILLLAGLIEFGWAYFHYLALQDAAGEGASYGIMFPTWHSSAAYGCVTNCNDNPNNIEYRVRHESQSDILDWTDPARTTVAVDAPFTTAGNLITVTVTYEHQLITPILIPQFGGGGFTLEARVVQRIVAPATP